jgi:hypothetical protein
MALKVILRKAIAVPLSIVKKCEITMEYQAK